jgi:transposase-like protein
MKYTIKNFKKQFATQDDCLNYIFRHRFGTKFVCPSCSKSSWHKVRGRKVWACAYCAYQIHPLAGTIFRKSNTDLTLWFFAIYKFANSRNGVAAKELQRDLGVTYKTAWRIAKQIRALMGSDDILSGIVEVDEGFIRTGSKKKKSLSKTAVLIERGGKARAFNMSSSKFFNTIPVIKQTVAAGSMVITDGASVYNKKKLAQYAHKSVNHSRKEYARGKIHTNTVEGFLGQIKRSIDGTYHRISEQHLQSYLDEFSFRLSHSRSPVPMFLVLLNRLCRLPYAGS